MLITKTSMLTGVKHAIDIDVTFAQLWQIDNKTDLIQRIVPHLTVAEREFLLTGITNDEWQEEFTEA